MNTYPLIQAGFAAVTIIFYGLLFKILNKGLNATDFSAGRKKKIQRITLLSIGIWTVILSILSLTGFLSDFSTLPPRQLIMLIVPLIGIIIAIRSEAGTAVLKNTPVQSLIYLQSFRVLVELLLWMLYLQHLAPVQMTFEGGNIDILSGLSAPLVAYFISKQKMPRLMIIAWNFLCLGFLANILITAVLSMPTPFRIFMNEPANTIVTQFPIVWLPGLLVPLAYGLHFISLRQLLLKDKVSA